MLIQGVSINLVDKAYIFSVFCTFKNLNIY